MLSANNQFYVIPRQIQAKRYRQNLLVALCLCAASMVLLAAQSSNPSGSVVLVRNARVIDRESLRLVETTVLVNGGKMTPVEASTPVPAGAAVIDGGGSVLTLGADGRIILRSDHEDTVFNNSSDQPPLCNEEAAIRGDDDFVAWATKRGDAEFVPVYDRIASFNRQ